MVVGTGPDNFVDISILRVDAGGAPGGAVVQGRVRRGAAPAPKVFTNMSSILVLASDGGNTDEHQGEGE